MPERGFRNTAFTAEQLNNKAELSQIKEQFLSTAEDVEAYKQWKQEVPASLQRIVEGHILGGKAGLSANKDNTPLVADFYNGFAKLLADPDKKATDLLLDARAQNMLGQLQKIVTDTQSGEFVNLFKAFNLSQTGFTDFVDYYNKRIKNKIGWLASKDQEDFVEYSEPEVDSDIDLQPNNENENSQVGRAQESKEKPTEALATVYPFYGGYYKGQVCVDFDINSFTWKPEQKGYYDLTEQRIDQEKKRIYRANASANKRNIIKLPYGWGVDQASIKWLDKKPEQYSFINDNDGLIYLNISSSASGQYPFSLEIAPTSDIVESRQPIFRSVQVNEQFSPELEQKATEIKQGKIPDIVKARQIVSFIRSHLEYDMNDYDLESVYKSDYLQYFNKIWDNKKAKCDEANTMAARLLIKNGFEVNYISGHSVQNKSDQGEALLLDSNRHAWVEVWDADNNQWERLDATPKGDPNVDEEEQDEDLGEGDYGEQESELMSEEELNEKLKKLEENENKAQSYEVSWAEQAGCDVETAKKILDKIRKLREKYRSVLNEASQYWQEVVRKNIRKKIEYRGPVPRSQGDELDDIVGAHIGYKSGDRDPLGWSRAETTEKEEKIFGGYEVYVGADMSGSMGEAMSGEIKSESQRDMVFLLIDSIMIQARESRKRWEEGILKANMPVKICLAVFGNTTEISLPLTENWSKSEQVAVYDALDKTAGGGTPDYAVLQLFQSEIRKSVEAENKKRARLSDHEQEKNPTINRFVLVAADGDSSSPALAKNAREQLEAMDIPVDLFLLADENDEHLKKLVGKTYKNFTLVSQADQLAEKGLKHLVGRLEERYSEE